MSKPRLRKCTDCPNITRPTMSKPTEFEVRTIRRVGEQCINCYRMAKGGRGNGRRKPAPEPQAPLENTLDGLHSYLRRRRDREERNLRRDYYMERLSA